MMLPLKELLETIDGSQVTDELLHLTLSIYGNPLYPILKLKPLLASLYSDLIYALTTY